MNRGRKMGYYMRYVVTDKKDLSLQTMEDSLKQLDQAYSIVNRQTGRVIGDLVHGGEVFAQIEINRSNDELFNEEVQELVEFAEDSEGKGKREVLKCLKKARLLVAVQVLFQERDTEATLQKIDPLWQWLFSNRDGLMQADGEGYYNGKGDLILKVE